MGNYHSFGASKFVPEIPSDTFKRILTSHPLYEDTHSLFREYFDRLWPLVDKEIHAMEKPYAQLGYPESGAVTSYFSPSMTAADLALIRDFLSEKKIHPENTRAFKVPTEGGHLFEITIGSID